MLFKLENFIEENNANKNIQTIYDSIFHVLVHNAIKGNTNHIAGQQGYNYKQTFICVWCRVNSDRVSLQLVYQSPIINNTKT